MSVRRSSVFGCELVVGAATDGEFARMLELFAEFDRTFSRFRADSELSRVNAAHALPVRVSPLFERGLRTALDAAAATGGAVDPTLGRNLEAAGYDRDIAELQWARGDAVAVVRLPARQAGSIRLVGRLLLPRRGVALDLNGVVKALAVDDAVALLRRPGFVGVGGDYAASAPLDLALPGGGSVCLHAGGMATSGTLTRRWRQGGEDRHHLIDPRTGRPSRSPWVAVTVAAGTCLAADVAAKAAFLLGRHGPAWLDDRGLAGRFLRADGQTVVTRAWRAAVLPPAA